MKEAEIAALAAQIPVADARAARAAQAAIDGKTKPRGSLGRLEQVAVWYAGIRGTAEPALSVKAIAVLVADHGIARAGVSAYPQEVTGQMLLNFDRGGAAINVLARAANAELIVADFGVAGPPAASTRIRQDRVAAGTADFTTGPAMTRQQAADAVSRGVALADELVARGVTLIGTGEMGIGNTTSSSAIAAVYDAASVADLVGPGTGLDAAGIARKRALVETALAFHRPQASDPLGVLAAVGGFEIAGLAGVILGAAGHGTAVVLDGFITGAAALVACRIAPAARGYLLASHESREPGHRHVLKALGLEPLLRLDLRLGEGSGAALAMPLVDAAVRILREMASFESAGVTDTGR